MLSEKLKQDLRNPWMRVILIIVGVTVFVNVAFIIYAFQSPPNLVVQDYYERGKNYFHDEKMRHEALPTAWRLQLTLADDLRVNHAETCRLYVMNHEGKPINQADVTLMAYYVSDASHDFQIQLKSVDAGTFAASVQFPLPGKWDLIARVKTPDHDFDTAKRIFVEK